MFIQIFLFYCTYICLFMTYVNKYLSLDSYSTNIFIYYRFLTHIRVVFILV
jgi:hypothetical protein